jgi:hypothetical protein
MAGFSKPLRLKSFFRIRVRNPGEHVPRFRLLPFRSPLLWESRLISFPGGTEMFQFPPLASRPLCIQERDSQGFLGRVSPFGNLRVTGYLRLTEAYRSLSRPSSPADAKASPVCPCSLPDSPSVQVEKACSPFPCIQHRSRFATKARSVF